MVGPAITTEGRIFLPLPTATDRILPFFFYILLKYFSDFLQIVASKYTQQANNTHY